MQSLLLLLQPLFVLGARADPRYTEVYSDYSQTGKSAYLDRAASNLESWGMDNDIESVRQTGMWMYYENESWNIDAPGSAYYVHGIDIEVTFPAEYQNIMSSLRRAGNEEINADTITFFEGAAFAGYGYIATFDSSISVASDVSGNVSSIVMTGPSPWTVYTGEDYTGSSWCLYNTDHDVGTDGTTQDLGIFPFVEDIGIPDNSLLSVRKGCHSARVAKAPKLPVDGRQENGAWGRLV